MSHPAALDPEQVLRECEITFTRRSGPGGQNRNKVETAVVLLHRPSGLTAEANERRSQGQNREVALRRLRVTMALEVRSDWQGPSELWRSRCRGGKVVVNPEHADLPALLAEALDALDTFAFDAKAASAELGCTTSQLVKFLAREPRALGQLNRSRESQGLPPYRVG